MKVNCIGAICLLKIAIISAVAMNINKDIIKTYNQTRCVATESVPSVALGELKKQEQMLRVKYPLHVDGKRCESECIDDSVVEFIKISQQIKALETKKQVKKNEIIAAMQDCETFESVYGSVTFRANKNGVRILRMPL
jgi:hypothetical protein